jgi:hypothetical protein
LQLEKINAAVLIIGCIVTACLLSAVIFSIVNQTPATMPATSGPPSSVGGIETTYNSSALKQMNSTGEIPGYAPPNVTGNPAGGNSTLSSLSNPSLNYSMIAASLSTRPELTQLREYGVTGTYLPASYYMGAKYFSCGYQGDGYGLDGFFIQVGGYIWDENGAFILCYGAALNPSTLQILNVSVYAPMWMGLGTPKIPRLQDYTYYVIAGAQ